jgi:hypothetical protein
MTKMLRMGIALVFQSISVLFRAVFCILFVCILPFDILSNAIHRFGFWLAVDKHEFNLMASSQEDHRK